VERNRRKYAEMVKFQHHKETEEKPKIGRRKK
jgi:hypothetical protein